LQQNFENPEITVQCFDKICKGDDPQGDLTHLTGKHLTKLLKTFGLPALEGKKTSRQISAILPFLRDLDAPLTIDNKTSGKGKLLLLNLGKRGH